jgi:hypothetical protein
LLPPVDAELNLNANFKLINGDFQQCVNFEISIKLNIFVKAFVCNNFSISLGRKLSQNPINILNEKPFSQIVIPLTEMRSEMF